MIVIVPGGAGRHLDLLCQDYLSLFLFLFLSSFIHPTRRLQPTQQQLYSRTHSWHCCWKRQPLTKEQTDNSGVRLPLYSANTRHLATLASCNGIAVPRRGYHTMIRPLIAVYDYQAVYTKGLGVRGDSGTTRDNFTQSQEVKTQRLWFDANSTLAQHRLLNQAAVPIVRGYGASRTAPAPKGNTVLNG